MSYGTVDPDTGEIPEVLATEVVAEQSPDPDELPDPEED